MISCGSASTITSVMLTWYIRSMPKGMIQLNPGWANRRYLPSRSTRARWVGRTIRMPRSHQNTTTGIMIHRYHMQHLRFFLSIQYNTEGTAKSR